MCGKAENVKKSKNLEKERLEKIETEYKRLISLFEGLDEEQLILIDGAILEAARMKIELDELAVIVNSSGGLVKVNPENVRQQKELPSSKLITKLRPNYLSYIDKLFKLLGKDTDDEDDEMSDYE
ncbi:zinc-binding protein [Clostridium perfringens]|uniref:zinc-binding protein n=1 Tax=Clostridium perfringens TaxID=1502 RepID=UPI001ABA2D00|nr:zinc-binding protein [Clostridium perfringens]MBO3344325.1 zinc-binding protein [Clostridium perfringens]MBO3347010.1 zinc-binding protein [Clostridium perfringens]MBO3350066.1 zinc-binding protein [Clostridium perfringens]MBO3370766.1 zinc-binding protein [Clostridium perfringens]MDM0609607.1 zinc-binding protein [Clostridium perfringens]